MSPLDTDRHYLSSLFEPASIAVIGASEREGSIGRRITRNLLDLGYAGELYLVNPRHAKVFDHATCKSAADLPFRVELAIICTAAEKVVDSVVACANAGMRNAIVLTAGYAQVGAGVTAIHREIGEIARRKGMRVLGPDSLDFCVQRPRSMPHNSVRRRFSAPLRSSPSHPACSAQHSTGAPRRPWAAHWRCRWAPSAMLILVKCSTTSFRTIAPRAFFCLLKASRTRADA